ncbi:hypothetical protein BSKO_11685 [Bryopsis sp. KO-2023]|nr:hypothetical protein BSKO_11685 [Bryopsis sp. KO-2023]
MINPPVVPVSWEESVWVNVASGDQPVRIAARQNGAVLASAEVPPNGGDVMICLASAEIGAVEVCIESMSGEQMTGNFALLVAPPIVAHEMSSLFYVAMKEHQATGVELDRWELVSRTWTRFLHPLIVDIGLVLKFASDKSESHQCLVSHLTEYFLLNGAFQAGQFILKAVGGAGGHVHLDGQTIDVGDSNFDLASLFHNRRNIVRQQLNLRS